MNIRGQAYIPNGEYHENVSVQGQGKCPGHLICSQDVHIAGMFTCEGNLKCASLLCAGILRVAGEIEAERISMSGMLLCEGLLNAEWIDFALSKSSCSVGSIGGSEIRVYREKNIKSARFSFFKKRKARNRGILSVREGIEGDLLDLEGVKTSKVIGRKVTIGEDCSIDLVQYSETVEIHPDAKVRILEKI